MLSGCAAVRQCVWMIGDRAIVTMKLRDLGWHVGLVKTSEWSERISVAIVLRALSQSFVDVG